MGLLRQSLSLRPSERSEGAKEECPERSDGEGFSKSPIPCRINAPSNQAPFARYAKGCNLRPFVRGDRLFAISRAKREGFSYFTQEKSMSFPSFLKIPLPRFAPDAPPLPPKRLFVSEGCKARRALRLDRFLCHFLNKPLTKYRCNDTI